jgi:hypothetical protein
MRDDATRTGAVVRKPPGKEPGKLRRSGAARYGDLAGAGWLGSAAMVSVVSADALNRLCCVCFPCVHAVATTQAQRLGG